MTNAYRNYLAQYGRTVDCGDDGYLRAPAEAWLESICHASHRSFSGQMRKLCRTADVDPPSPSRGGRYYTDHSARRQRSNLPYRGSPFAKQIASLQELFGGRLLRAGSRLMKKCPGLGVAAAAADAFGRPWPLHDCFDTTRSRQRQPCLFRPAPRVPAHLHAGAAPHALHAPPTGRRLPTGQMNAGGAPRGAAQYRDSAPLEGAPSASRRNGACHRRHRGGAARLRRLGRSSAASRLIRHAPAMPQRMKPYGEDCARWQRDRRKPAMHIAQMLGGNQSAWSVLTTTGSGSQHAPCQRIVPLGEPIQLSKYDMCDRSCAS